MSRHILPALVFFSVFTPLAAAAQQAAPPAATPSGTQETWRSRTLPPGEDWNVEAWGGLALVVPRTNGRVTTEYLPVVQNISGATGSAGQTLWFNGGNTLGLAGGVNHFITPVFGVQILVDYDHVGLSGENGPYEIDLHVPELQPPDYVPTTFVHERSIPWPETTGTLKQLTLGFNAVARQALDDRFTVHASAGLAFATIAGHAQPLGYTYATLLGHSAFSASQYQLTFDLDRGHSFGFDIGGGLDVRITPHVRATADLRFLKAGSISLPVRITGQLGDEYLSQAAAEVQQTLGNPVVSVSPSRTRLMFGLKVGWDY